MNNQYPFLLTSQAVQNGFRGDRHILSRVIIPVEVVEQYEHLPQKHIWWVEKSGKSFYLRAKLYVVEATIECELKSNLRRAVWHLDTARSERITWSGYTQYKANITSILSKASPDNVGGINLIPVTEEVDKELEECRLSVCEQALGFENAARILKRLFSSSIHHIPLNPPKTALSEALHYIHEYFVREELVNACDKDPYELAAVVLLGYSELPEDPLIFDKEHDVFVTDISEFSELDEEHIGYIERIWKSGDGRNDSLNSLEAKTKRHQQIVQLLARDVRERGFNPTYNRHIDLRIELEECQMFFEVKTADSSNFQKQIRYAAGQLLEYRYRYNKHNNGKKIRLAIVIEGSASDSQYAFARSFLLEIGIVMILWQPKTNHFDGLNELLG